jgi:putative transposase
MKENAKNFNVGKMASVLQVSRGAYYKFLGRSPSKRSLENKRLTELIEEMHKENRETYGSPRIHAELKARGEVCSRKRVATLMRRKGIRAKMTKRRKRTTIVSKKKKGIFPNLLDQNFEVEKPDKVYASDITYIPTEEGWLYLSVTLDLFSRKVIGMTMENRLETSLSTKALGQALKHRKTSSKEEVLHHSDRGVQYTSEKFQSLAKQNKIKLSMSGKGHCYDNAVVESFFHTLKTEHVFFERYRTREEAMVSLFEYIETFYNRKRRHSTLGYLSPEEFEQKYEKENKRVLSV